MVKTKEITKFGISFKNTTDEHNDMYTHLHLFFITIIKSNTKV